MNRRVFIALTALWVGLSCGTVRADSNTTSSILLVGVDTSFMPFEFKQAGQYVGFDIDLWAAIAKDRGWRYELRPLDFNGLIPGLQTRQLDVALAGIAINEARRKAIDFSMPYYDSGLAVAMRVGDGKVSALNELNGRRIAAKTGTATIDWLKTHLPQAKISQFPNIDQAYMALEAGRVDAAMHDTPNVQYFVNTAGKGKAQLVGQPVDGDQYGIAFPKGSALVSEVDSVLAAMKGDGRYRAIYQKWFGVAPPAAYGG